MTNPLVVLALVLSIAAVGFVMGARELSTHDGPLVSVPIDPMLPPEAVDGVRQIIATAHSVALNTDALISDLKTKVANTEDVFGGLQDAVKLLQGEAIAVEASNDAVRLMAYAVIGAMVFFAWMAWRQHVILRALLNADEDEKERWEEYASTMRSKLRGGKGKPS